LCRALVTGAADAAVRLRAPATAVTASPAVAHVTARRRRLLVIRMNAPCFASRAPRRGRCRAGVRSAGRAGFNAAAIEPPGGAATYLIRTRWAAGRSDAMWAAVRSRTAGDDALVTELYRQYRVPLMAYVLRLTAGDRQQAEDVVQETMLRAWRQAGKLDLTEPSLMPWLTTVARRIVIDDKRRKSARPAETGDGMLENAPAADSTEELLRK